MGISFLSYAVGDYIISVMKKHIFIKQYYIFIFLGAVACVALASIFLAKVADFQAVALSMHADTEDDGETLAQACVLDELARAQLLQGADAQQFVTCGGFLE